MGLYEILHGTHERRKPRRAMEDIDVEARPSSTPTSTEDYPEPAQETAEDSVAGAAVFPLAVALIAPAPLRALPLRWGLEIQRITHYLKTGRERTPQVLTFSGLATGVGVTTVSYMVAHHMASSSAHERVLYLEVSPKRHDNDTSHAQLLLGQPVDWAQWPTDFALSAVSVRGGAELSVAEKVRWYQQFVAEARTHFHQIIVDAPAFYGGAEAYLISSVSDGVVLVLKSGAARRTAVNALISELQQMDVEVLGAVLNFREYPIPRWLLRWL